MHDIDEIIGAKLEGAGLGGMIGREASALREEEWQAIDDEAVTVLRDVLTARPAFARVVDTRYTGAGWLEVKGYKRAERAAAKTDESGDPEAADLPTLTSFLTRTMVHHAETRLPWRHLEASRHGRENLDVSGIAEAAAVVGQREDDAWYNGQDPLADGVLKATGKTTAVGSDWSGSTANPFNDLNAIAAAADAAGHVGPRVLVVHPTNMKELRTPHTGKGGSSLTEAKESDLIQDVVVTNKATLGTCSVIHMNPAYLRWFLMVDTMTEQLASPGRDVLLSTLTIQAQQIRQAATIHERTGI